MTEGIKGYKENVKTFVEVSQSLDFDLVCKEFIPFLPKQKNNVLDIGSGAGQNSAALAALGFAVTAIDPVFEFIEASKTSYRSTSITWLKGSLPKLACLEDCDKKYDFVLIEAVWHHLNEDEREQSAAQISKYVSKHGRCAISLRNGPAGLGTRVFSTDPISTCKLFERYGFDCVHLNSNIDSILPNKQSVKWSRLVLQKT